MDGKKNILLKVTPEFHRQIKLYTALHGTSMQQYIIGLILDDMKAQRCK